MKIYEIIAEAGNGSVFRYGPNTVNDQHPCVDPNDPSCPGHKAGLKFQLTHPHDAVDIDPSHPSFVNGREQAANMITHGYKAIAPTINRKGVRGFIAPNMGNFKIPTPPPLPNMQMGHIPQPVMPTQPPVLPKR